MRDILQCHNMFHIELAEYIRVWDLDEKIGNVFTASVSILLDLSPYPIGSVYSLIIDCRVTDDQLHSSN